MKSIKAEREGREGRREGWRVGRGEPSVIIADIWLPGPQRSICPGLSQNDRRNLVRWGSMLPAISQHFPLSTAVIASALLTAVSSPSCGAAEETPKSLSADPAHD